MNFLLLRGLVREQRHWDSFPTKLAEKFPGSRVLTLDLPGTGTEYLRDSPTTITEIAEDLRERFPRNEGPWTIVAVSLGGMVAIEWSSRWTADFARVVVINTSAGDCSKPWERLDWRNYGTVLRAAATADHSMRERAIVNLTINREDFDRDALVEKWTGYARERPVRRGVLLSQLAAAARSKLPQSMPVPMLVLASKADRLVRSVCSERIAARLSVPIQMHERGGHDLPFDDADWVGERIAEWMRA